MDQALVIRRRFSVYFVFGIGAMGLTAGFGYMALFNAEPFLWIPSAVCAVLAVLMLWALHDARTPMFVADEHGVRLRFKRDWIGLLWSEVADIRIVQRQRFQDAYVKVISIGGSQIYTTPIGFATTVTAGVAEAQLAQLRSASAY